MRPVTLFLTVCLLIFFSTAAAAVLPAASTQPAMQAYVLSEDVRGLTVQLEFVEPQLRALDEGEAGVRLWVDMPNATIDFDAEGPAQPVMTRLLAVPEGFRATAEVIRLSELRLEAEAVVARDAVARTPRRTSGEIPLVSVGDAGWMRTMRVAPVAVRPVRYDAGDHIVQAVRSMTVRFEFVPDGSPSTAGLDPERYHSLAFDELFRAMLLNPGALPNVMPTGSVIRRGTYLIITDSALAPACVDLVEWKRAKGFNVVVAPIITRGIPAEDVKAYIRNAFYNWERPVEFVLLAGDVNQPGIQIPAFLITNPKDRRERDVTDWPYVELRGEDYFPDAFIGRMSTDSPTPSDLRRQILRVVDYEKSIASFDADNFRRATLFAGNYGEGGAPVLSPVETMRWLGERLQAFGYDQIEEFYYRSGNDDITSGRIARSISRGVNIVSYRGWADARGTHYPQFYIADLQGLSNDQPLPVMTFFVCNTGDYGNNEVNPCFGEAAHRQGTFRRPTAALSFFGPSDLHTSTLYNNPLAAGYYTGLMYESLRNLSALTLRSKMEVWRGLVHQRGYNAENNFVQFYFSCYNILGDPEVSLYFTAPKLIDVEHPQTLAVGDTRVRVRVVQREGNRPVYGALVNLLKGDETEVSVLTDRDGTALLPVNLATPDSLQITVIGHQLAAYQTKIPVATADRMVSLREVRVLDEDGGNLLKTGETVSLTLVLANTGRQAASNVTATVSSPIDGVQLADAEVQFGDIAPGATAVARSAVRVSLDPHIYPYTRVPFTVQIRDAGGGNWQALARLQASSGWLAHESHSFSGGLLNPGATQDLVVALRNFGNKRLTGLRGQLECFDEAVEIVSGSASFGGADVNAIAHNSGEPFRITARPETWNGRKVALRLAISDADGRLINRVFFNITIGRIRPSDPIGPDGYGYYLYENSDDDRYDAKPAYEWIELDPAFGGQGAQHHPLRDDSTFAINLPFTFRYYGDDYDRISICSNGWFSFEETWMWNFRNWQMPSPLGPHALVAPYWDDLVGQMINDSTRGFINVYTRADANEGRFIIQWSRAVARTTVEDVPQTVQAILYDPARVQTPTGDGEMAFQYHEVRLVERREDNYATVGMEDWLHERGLMLTFAGDYEPGADTLRAGRAIKVTTVPPDNYLSVEQPPAPPDRFSLGQAYPNPFNGFTRVSFNLPSAGWAKLNLYDLNGRHLMTVASERFAAGSHQVGIDASGLPSGLYILRLESGGKTASRRVLLIR